jgi:hypothetical protein
MSKSDYIAKVVYFTPDEWKEVDEAMQKMSQGSFARGKHISEYLRMAALEKARSVMTNASMMRRIAEGK